jgi:hypothetical protein
MRSGIVSCSSASAAIEAIEASGDAMKYKPFRQVTLIGFGEAGGILGEGLAYRASEPFSWKALADAIGKASPIESEALTDEAKQQPRTENNRSEGNGK